MKYFDINIKSKGKWVCPICGNIIISSFIGKLGDKLHYHRQCDSQYEFIEEIKI